MKNENTTLYYIKTCSDYWIEVLSPICSVLSNIIAYILRRFK